MLTIVMREHNNGFSVSGFSDDECVYIFDEVAETKLDALDVVREWLAEELDIERRKMTCN